MKKPKAKKVKGRPEFVAGTFKAHCPFCPSSMKTLYMTAEYITCFTCGRKWTRAE